MRDCQVNHLRLRTSDAEAARHAALLVEDALHTASLPADGGRLVIIRSLALGRIGRNASPLAVSLQIEQALQRLPAQLIHAAQPAAAGADAVYFRDEAEALVLLARQVAQGEPPTAWFWPRIAPGYHATLPTDDLLRIVLRTALKQPGRGITLLRLMQALVEAGVTAALLNVIQPADGAHLLAHYGWPTATPIDPPAHSGRRQRPLFTALLKQWIGRWGEDDLRTLWLANLLSVIEQPLALSDPQVSRRSRQWITQTVVPKMPAYRLEQTAFQASQPAEYPTESAAGVGRAPANVAPTDAIALPQRAAVVDPPEQTNSVVRPPSPQDEPAQPSQRFNFPDQEGGKPLSPQAESARHSQTRFNFPDQEGGKSLSPQAESARHSQHISVSEVMARAPGQADEAIASASLADATWIGALHATTAGGLFFLLAALTRLGLGGWLRDHPLWLEVDLTRRLLAAVCHQMATPPADPIWQTLALDGPAVDATDLFWFAAPAPWADWGIRAAQPEPARLTVDQAVQAWLAALTHWCTDFAELDLARIVMRPGRLHATSTHIDLYFDLAQVDLRIRRAGLDIDPGWLAWFGRVVLFHYE